MNNRKIGEKNEVIAKAKARVDVTRNLIISAKREGASIETLRILAQRHIDNIEQWHKLRFPHKRFYRPTSEKILSYIND